MAKASDKSKDADADEGKVAGFSYDNSSTGSDAPVSFAVIPGIWHPGEVVLPSAFGLTVTQMRDAIREFNLPLKETKVAAGDAVGEIDRGLNHLPVETGSLSAPAKPSDERTETHGGPIPAVAPQGVHRPLLPLAAAHQARNTVLASGGSLSDAAEAARAAGGEWGEAVAAATETGTAGEALVEHQEEQVASGELVDPETVEEVTQ